MNKSIREQVLEKIMAVLLPAATECVANLYRSPTLALPPEDCPALLVFPVKGTVETSNQLVIHKMTVRLIALARGDSANADADSLMVHANQALVNHQKWSEVCQSCKETDWEYEIEDADPEIAAIQSCFVFEFRTARNDPTEKR